MLVFIFHRYRPSRKGSARIMFSLCKVFGRNSAEKGETERCQKLLEAAHLFTVILLLACARTGDREMKNIAEIERNRVNDPEFITPFMRKDLYL